MNNEKTASIASRLIEILERMHRQGKLFRESSWEGVKPVRHSIHSVVVLSCGVTSAWRSAYEPTSWHVICQIRRLIGERAKTDWLTPSQLAQLILELGNKFGPKDLRMPTEIPMRRQFGVESPILGQVLRLSRRHLSRHRVTPSHPTAKLQSQGRFTPDSPAFRRAGRVFAKI